MIVLLVSDTMIYQMAVLDRRIVEKANRTGAISFLLITSLAASSFRTGEQKVIVEGSRKLRLLSGGWRIQALRNAKWKSSFFWEISRTKTAYWLTLTFVSNLSDSHATQLYYDPSSGLVWRPRGHS